MLKIFSLMMGALTLSIVCATDLRASGTSCIYGGWISSMGGGDCLHPYNGNQNYQACGLQGVHRCNPHIFGESDQGSFPGSHPGRGVCVKSKREDSASITWACIKSAYGSSDGEGIDLKYFHDGLEDIEGKEHYLGRYLLEATGIVEEYCQKAPDNFCTQSSGICDDLKRSFFDKTSSNPALIVYGNQHKILLENINDFPEGDQKRWDISFPLVEESRVWKNIQQNESVMERFWDGKFWSYWCNPYDILEKNQLKLLRLGYRSCLKKKNLLERQMINLTPWGAMTLGQRAKRIYQLAKESYADIKATATNFVSKSGVFRPDEMHDGDVFHKDVVPAMAACFAYHETKGVLSPIKRSYSYCGSYGGSKAYGLGQITLLTLKDILYMNNGSNLPFSTPESKKFAWHGHSEEIMDGEEIHHYMNFSPKFQMELVLRVLNRKAKVANHLKGNRYNLAHLVRRYYGCSRDDVSCQKEFEKYLRSVSSCLKCFDKGHSASDCYYNLEKCESSDCKRARRKGNYSP